MAKITRSSKMPAKPKYKPLPKAPGMSASVAAWKAYEKRVQTVTQYNLAKKAEYDKKISAIKSIEKMKMTIRERIKNVRKRVPFGSAREEKVYG